MKYQSTQHSTMTKFLIASTGHKDFLTPSEACSAIAKGLQTVCDPEDIQIVPMADGGDGTIDAILASRGGEIISVKTHDSLFRERAGKMGLVRSSEMTAVIEIAEAAGSAILRPHERQTMVATSYGVGEMILAAVDLGCSKIIIGLGGSIVSDGGLGMAQALGVTFLDKNGKQLNPISNSGFNALSLNSIASFQLDGLKIDLDRTEIVVASDVDIPLLGRNGQARTFGPQKGASNIEIEYLAHGFENLVRVINKVVCLNVDVPLAGAAGGLGAGLMGFLNAKLFLGAHFIAREINLEAKIKNVETVIVGEGCLDQTSFSNKALYYTANLAKKYGKPVIALVGIHHDCDTSSFCDRVYVCHSNDSDVEMLTSSAIENQLQNTAAMVINTYLKANMKELKE